MSWSSGTWICAGWYTLEAIGLWYFLILKPAVRWLHTLPS